MAIQAGATCSITDPMKLVLTIAPQATCSADGMTLPCGTSSISESAEALREQEKSGGGRMTQAHVVERFLQDAAAR